MNVKPTGQKADNFLIQFILLKSQIDNLNEQNTFKVYKLIYGSMAGVKNFHIFFLNFCQLVESHSIQEIKKKFNRYFLYSPVKSYVFLLFCKKSAVKLKPVDKFIITW